MSYVQIRYSGFVLSGGKELRGLTPSGTGSGTQLDHIQIHNSSDDGIEFFGDSTHLKYLVLTGNVDDYMASDIAFPGTASFVFAAQPEGGTTGDSFLTPPSTDPNTTT